MMTVATPWQVAYGVVALLFAIATIGAGHHWRAGEPPSVAVQATGAVAAGALWPVMIIGLMQLWLIRHVVTRQCGRRTNPATQTVRLVATH